MPQSNQTPRARDVSHLFFDCGMTPEQKIANSNAAWARINRRHNFTGHTEPETANTVPKYSQPTEVGQKLRQEIMKTLLINGPITLTTLMAFLNTGQYNLVQSALSSMITESRIRKYKDPHRTARFIYCIPRHYPF